MNAATALVFLAQLVLIPIWEDTEEPLLCGSQALSEINQVGFRTCIAQHRDLSEAMGCAFTLQDYWQLAAAKSGQCFAWACQAGATLGGGILVSSCKSPTTGQASGRAGG